jgi:predicted signal transduction protein with EAL and GGDEF domain
MAGLTNYKLQRNSVNCTASIGITLYPNGAADIDDLLKKAAQV